ncbi:MAG: serine/threonine-protein kinase [Elusimicrobiota bacterium]
MTPFRAAARLGSAAVLVFLSVSAAGPLGAARGDAPASKDKTFAVRDPEVQARLEKTRLEIEELMEELEPFLAKLTALKDSYGGKSDLDELSMQRGKLLAELRPRLERFDYLRHEWGEVRSYSERRMMALAAKRFVNEQIIPQDAAQAMIETSRTMEFSRRSRQFRGNIYSMVQAESLAYKTAVDARNTRRTWFGVIGALCAALVAALVFAWRSTRARTAELMMRTPTGQPALPGGQLPALAGPSGSVNPEAGALLGGNYRIDGELGRGGMGVVYEATDVTLHRKVAIKRMREELAGAGKDLEMFLSEARMVASLKHPNLVEIYSILREGGQLFLVFEHVTGRLVSDFIDEGRRISLRSTTSVIKQVGSALDYAHSRKVIHRDLKPSNIMVTPEGVAKVMDFGIAHQAKMTVAKLTRTAAWGTPAYMAPEQELGEVSRESDLFSLGVCLYEMVSGQTPFQGPNFLAQKQGSVYTPLSRRVAGLPEGTDEFVRRALQPAPKDRFHTAAELFAALDRLVKDDKKTT